MGQAALILSQCIAEKVSSAKWCHPINYLSS
jgi:hypothetical protein